MLQIGENLQFNMRSNTLVVAGKSTFALLNLSNKFPGTVSRQGVEAHILSDSRNPGPDLKLLTHKQQLRNRSCFLWYLLLKAGQE